MLIVHISHMRDYHIVVTCWDAYICLYCVDSQRDWIIESINLYSIHNIRERSREYESREVYNLVNRRRRWDLYFEYCVIKSLIRECEWICSYELLSVFEKELCHLYNRSTSICIVSSCIKAVLCLTCYQVIEEYVRHKVFIYVGTYCIDYFVVSTIGKFESVCIG